MTTEAWVRQLNWQPYQLIPFKSSDHSLVRYLPGVLLYTVYTKHLHTKGDVGYNIHIHKQKTNSSYFSIPNLSKRTQPRKPPAKIASLISPQRKNGFLCKKAHVPPANGNRRNARPEEDKVVAMNERTLKRDERPNWMNIMVTQADKCNGMQCNATWSFSGQKTKTIYPKRCRRFASS